MEQTFTRQNYASGAPLEEKFGYSRMVKVGPYIMIGGTTSVQADGSVNTSSKSRSNCWNRLGRQWAMSSVCGDLHPHGSRIHPAGIRRIPKFSMAYVLAVCCWGSIS